MDQKNVLEVLEADLPDIQSEVIQAIIDLRKIDKRTSQKDISNKFDVPKKDVKTIFDRMKKFEVIDLNSTQSTTTSEKGKIGDSDGNSSTGAEEHGQMGNKNINFSSVDELKRFFGELGASEGAAANDSLIRTVKTSSQVDMLSDSNVQRMAENPGNNDDELINPGDMLIDYVKWYVGSASGEIASLRADQDLFDAEKRNLKGQIHLLREAEREKDLKIAKLTSELKAANALSKSKVCSRCEEPKKFSVAEMNFCGLVCIRKASIDLRGAEGLTIE